MIIEMKKVTFLLFCLRVVLSEVTEYVANAPVSKFSTNYVGSVDWTKIQDEDLTTSINIPDDILNNGAGSYNQWMRLELGSSPVYVGCVYLHGESMLGEVTIYAHLVINA